MTARRLIWPLLAFMAGCSSAPLGDAALRLEERVFKPASRCRSVAQAIREMRSSGAREVEVCVDGLLVAHWEGVRVFIDYTPGVEKLCLVDGPGSCPGYSWSDSLLPERDRRRIRAALLFLSEPVGEFHGRGLLRAASTPVPGAPGQVDHVLFLTRLDYFRVLSLEERRILSGIRDLDSF